MRFPPRVPIRPQKATRCGRCLTEEKMKLLTIFALATKTECELRVMFRDAAARAARTEPHTDECRIARATMENILIALRRVAPRP
jgi:hypothetical protein